MSVGGDPTSPVRPPSGVAAQGDSPAGSRTKVREFTQVEVVNTPMGAEEMRQQVCVLTSEVQSLLGAVVYLRSKHNDLVDEVTTAFTVVEDSFKTQETRWQKCYEDVHGIKAKFDLHDQHFMDCKILMDARQKEANELFKRFDEEVTKLTRNMNDKADFVLTRFVPEALEEFQGKMKLEMSNFKEH